MAINTVQAIINGTTHTLTLNSTSGKYEKQITSPTTSSYNNNSGHYYPITVKATDTAGNAITINDTDSSLGNSLKLFVKETVAPITTITAPTEGQFLINNKPTATWKVTDNDSGVNPDTIGITIDNGSKITSGITKTAITGGYQCSYTISNALPDGNHTIKIDAQDFDGNNSVQRTVNFKIDTVPPTLSVNNPANNLITNNSAVTVSGTTNDATSSPVTLTVKLNSGTAQSVTVQSNGTFSKSITLIEGTNTIIVVSTDAAGRSTSVTRTVTLDTKAPNIVSVSVTPNPVSTGNIITISANVTD